ncbi:unnamed protein product [Calypogeia fissa]
MPFVSVFFVLCQGSALIWLGAGASQGGGGSGLAPGGLGSQVRRGCTERGMEGSAREELMSQAGAGHTGGSESEMGKSGAGAWREVHGPALGQVEAKMRHGDEKGRQ